MFNIHIHLPLGATPEQLKAYLDVLKTNQPQVKSGMGEYEQQVFDRDGKTRLRRGWQGEREDYFKMLLESGKGPVDEPQGEGAGDITLTEENAL